MSKISQWHILGIILFWSFVISLRVESGLLCIIFVVISIFKFKYKISLQSVIAILCIAAPFNPYMVTLQDFPGKPRFVSCCSGMPLRYPEILEEQRQGKCMICRCVGPIIHPKFYWVW